ncbi:MAG: hypothetical protein C3F11_08370 [Methylocystaceae bacterium]|nr:MAG: hypothetical protein C3F11_08370 [Methylocystaceae bacterium]
MQQPQPEISSADDLAKLSKKKLIEIVLLQQEFIDTALGIITMHVGAICEDMTRATDALETRVKLALGLDGRSSNGH